MGLFCVEEFVFTGAEYSNFEQFRYSLIMMKIVLLALALCIALSAVEARKHKKAKRFRNAYISRGDDDDCDTDDKCADEQPDPAKPDDGEECVPKKPDPAQPDQPKPVHDHNCVKKVGANTCVCKKACDAHAQCAALVGGVSEGCLGAILTPKVGNLTDCAAAPNGNECQCNNAPAPPAENTPATNPTDNTDNTDNTDTTDTTGTTDPTEPTGTTDPSRRKISSKKAVKIIHRKPAKNFDDEEERIACTGAECDEAEDENEEEKEPAKPKAKKLKSKKQKSIKKKKNKVKKSIH